MDSRLILKSHLTAQLNSQQIQQTEVKPNQSEQHLHLNDVAISVGGFIGLFTFGAVMVASLTKLVTNARNHKVILPNHPLYKVPCRNCQFYSNNHYLNCAVRPELVMTEEAKDCTDFCAKKG